LSKPFTFPTEVPILDAVTSRGKRIFLRQSPLSWTEEWVSDVLYPALTSMDLSAFHPVFQANSIKDVTEFYLEYPLRGWQRQTMIATFIYDEADQIIGVRWIYSIDHNEGKGVLGTATVNRELRGQGIMPAATEVFINWLATLGLHRLEAHIATGNVASQRSISKVGFCKRGYLPFDHETEVWCRSLAS
jgi:RimJ/RimL family protein N-acetyltransferase